VAARRSPRAAAASAPPAWRASAVERAAAVALARRRLDLERLGRALGAHDPQRTLERGYALVEDAAGEPVTDAGSARARPSLVLRLHDGRVPVRPAPGPGARTPPSDLPLF